MTAPLGRRIAAELSPDPSRVVARLFLPGEQPHIGRSRAGAIVARVLALTEPEVEALAARLVADFDTRHGDYPALLARHAEIVAMHIGERPRLSPARTLVLGAGFTAEYTIEGAALCNPSAVRHPDQTGLDPGQLRVAVSLRAIGEVHVSSIGFCSAVLGPGPRWTFTERDLPATAGVPSPARWHNEHLRAVLADQGSIDELGSTVLHALADRFDGADLERVLAAVHPDLLSRPSAQGSVDLLRRLVSSAYRVDFDPETTLAQRVLLPSAAEESDGMEDARFTRFVADDGEVEYRATYTAYDGQQIAPRLLLSADLRSFSAHRLTGPAARNKGMALFPRLIGGEHLALCRSDGESISLSRSKDGFDWARPALVHAPVEPWEMLQVGNCGPPIETDQGWLVLTHGVGAMRTYSIGAILLDLDDPRRVIGRLRQPLLTPEAGERDGYVPNVLYSCGGLTYDGRLWLPYGIDDARIGVAWADLDELLGALASGAETSAQPASSRS